jgi:hypothetical protein
MQLRGKVAEAISTELKYQRLKAVHENWKKEKTPVEYAVLMEEEIREAKQGFCKNDSSIFGRNTTEHEILQTVCLGLEMLNSLPDEQLQKLIDSTVAAVKAEFQVTA